MTTEQLLTELRGSRTDLPRVVGAAPRKKLPYLVVPTQSVRAWEQRESDTWASVRNWLAAHSIAVVEV
jgi:hypothetical protein